MSGMGKCYNTDEEKPEKERHRPRRAMEELRRGRKEWFCMAYDSCKQLEN
jgi:hypothetical protein